MVRVTSAWLRGGRLPEPAKMTSSMPPARMALAELAPMTQRRASSRLDFPQPFGPTMPVSPGSIRNSVGSTKDLKPERRSRWKCTGAQSSFRASLHRRRDRGVEFLHGHGAFLHHLAVDGEGGGGADAGLPHGLVDAGVERLDGFLVLDAGV